jgi:hypothetical protein
MQKISGNSEEREVILFLSEIVLIGAPPVDERRFCQDQGL